jgi:hypothetical protein
MQTATMLQLIDMVRAEAGHSLMTSQGLNSVESLKHLIRRTEYELWTAFRWPMLTIRKDLVITKGQPSLSFPVDMDLEQIFEVFWMADGSTNWTKMGFGVPEDGILPDGAASRTQASNSLQLWDVYFNQTTGQNMIRVWPTPTQNGHIRLKGQRLLNATPDDTDYCTLDSITISLFVAAELLARAKADDAASKMQKAQRQLLKLRARLVDDKQKVTTYGTARGAQMNKFNSSPFLDYIP